MKTFRQVFLYSLCRIYQLDIVCLCYLINYLFCVSVMH